MIVRQMVRTNSAFGAGRWFQPPHFLARSKKKTKNLQARKLWENVVEMWIVRVDEVIAEFLREENREDEARSAY